MTAVVKDDMVETDAAKVDAAKVAVIAHRRKTLGGGLPELRRALDAAGISASYKDGVLTIRLPQRAEAKPKQIVIGD